MPPARTFLTTDDLTDLVRAACGTDRRIHTLTRLRGGSCKGVYRVTLDDGSTMIAYRWDPAENFWPASTILDTGPFQGADAGLATFLAARDRLAGVGVRVPAVYGTAGADLALVEDFRAGTLEDLLQRDPDAGTVALDRLGTMIRRMHAHTSPGFGPTGADFAGHTCEEFILRRGLSCLAEAATRVPRIAAVQDRLKQALRGRAAAVPARSTHGLIHAELGPDHVMVADDGEPVLIDIEGVMFFDVEWEHAFLELRFNDRYPALHAPGLDEHRLRLCRLAMYLSLVAGPLLLLDGDFPRPDAMRQIAEWNTGRTLAEIGVPQPN